MGTPVAAVVVFFIHTYDYLRRPVLSRGIWLRLRRAKSWRLGVRSLPLAFWRDPPENRKITI
jgi:hypothetical protein